MAVVTLRAHPIARVAHLFGGAVLGAFAVVLFLDEVWLLLGAPTLLIAGIIAIRGYRLAVLLAPEELVIRGNLWNRRIARGDLVSVPGRSTEFTGLRWRDGGRERWAYIAAVSVGDSVLASAVRRRADENLRAMQRWRSGRG